MMSAQAPPENGQTECFRVREAECEEDYDFMTRLFVNEERYYLSGAKIIHSIAPVSQPGYFIAELNGERIGLLCACNYGDEIQFISFFLLDSHHRRKGYGGKLWNSMWAKLNKEVNIGLNAVPEMVYYYERFGLQKVWYDTECEVSATKAWNVLEKEIPPTNIRIKSLGETNFDKLLCYDTQVFGAPRRSFLEQWITVPESFGWALINDKEDIVGYVVVIKAVKRDMQLIGPLFADSLSLAKVLLREVARMVIANDASHMLMIRVPEGENPSEGNSEAVELVKREIGCEKAWKCVRMYTMGVPKKSDVKKTFAITSPEFG